MTQPCPMTLSGRSECAQLLVVLAAANGMEIHVSALPPIVASPWVTGYTCPHGVAYWIEPTSEQIAAWAEQEVP